jgi:hypothetical protein
MRCTSSDLIMVRLGFAQLVNVETQLRARQFEALNHC